MTDVLSINLTDRSARPMPCARLTGDSEDSGLGEG